MAEITADFIEERNKKFLESLQGNVGTMARFHKYEVADLTSFAIEAPAMFTAVASAELWEKHFHRKINTNAKGVTLIKDGKKTVYYDVSETEKIDKTPLEVKLWQYDDTEHKKFLDAVVTKEKSTEKQIKIIAEELSNRSSTDEKSKKLMALSVEAVILERMGYSTENATRQLAKLSFKEHDIPKILEETQKTARIFLDAMQKSINHQAAENLDIPENNPLLKEMGVIQSSEKIKEKTIESELKLKPEPVQSGLFDDFAEEQDNKSVEPESKVSIEKFEENPESEKVNDNVENIETADVADTLTDTAEVVNEEVSTTDNNAEIVDTEVIEGSPENISDSQEVNENIKTDKISEIDDNEKVAETNTDDSEVIDAEIVEEMAGTPEPEENVDTPFKTMTNEENDDSDYDFEEMEEEEEILPDISEKQNEVENIISENDSEQFQTVEENSHDEIEQDLEVTLADDMKVIRGNSREKIVFRNNVKVIRTLQFIEKEKRAATPEEIAVLKDYAGFGGIPKAFDKEDPNWNREAWLLQSMLTEKEYNNAKASTLNAHYTSSEIVQGIYDGLKNLGFYQGTILEPSMGVGGFFGNMPDEMKSGSHLYGVELDSLTGRIAQKIYPDAEISVQGFEDTRYLNNSFDIAVGNVPFGNYRVNDKGYNENHFLIHDYFIAKMIDQVRPGGIVAVITSRGTLDKQDSNARKYFARRADLIRAVRLPNNAFKEAGTEVTSDILFFQKLENVRDDENLPNWVNVTSFQGERDITINRYFEEHPEDVLGTLKKTSTAYGFDLTCEPDKDHQLSELLSKSMESMRQIYSSNLIELPLPQQIPDIENKRSSSYFIENGELKFYNGVKIENVKINAKDRTQMLLAMDMRDSVRNVIDIQVNDDTDDELKKAQAELNQIYDKYVKNYGHICEDSTLKKIFSRDSAYPLLRSLEEYGKEGYKGKSPIFSKRMIEPHRQPTHADTPADALAISMQEIGYVDLDYMKSLTGQTEEEIIKALEFERIYFDFQKKEYQLAEEFLSGDIRAKMEFVESKINQIDAEINKKIAENILNIAPVPVYEPKNEIERKILECNLESDSYFSFNNFYDKDEEMYYDDYIETQKDNHEFLVEIALRHGTSIEHDKIGKILSDKPLIALEAIRRGRDVGYVKQADLLILSYLRTIGENFERKDEEHDLMLYDFLICEQSEKILNAKMKNMI